MILRNAQINLLIKDYFLSMPNFWSLLDHAGSTKVSGICVSDCLPIFFLKKLAKILDNGVVDLISFKVCLVMVFYLVLGFLYIVLREINFDFIIHVSFTLQLLLV